MFCPKCGSQIADGALFCPVCGSTLAQAAPMRSAEPQETYQQPVQQYQQSAQPAYQQPAQPVYQQPAQQYQQPYQQVQQPYYGGYNSGAAQQERMANMQEMDQLRGYFSQKASEYDEYDMINATLDEYDKKRPGLLVWGIILFVIGVFMLIGFAEGDLEEYIYIPIVWCLGSIGMILAFIFTSIARNKNKTAAIIRLVELTDELHTHFVNYGYCPVGEEFTNPAILGRIGDNLRTGRANNIQEAINIMFDDAHKSQMEFAAMETLYNTRLIEAHTQEIANNTAQAASGARAAAVFAAANFFLK